MLALHTSITSYISLTVCSLHCLWLSEERKWMASLLSLRMKPCCFGILCWSSQELRSKLKRQADRFRLGHTWACLSGTRCWGLKPHHADLWPFYQCFYAATGPQSQMYRLLQWPQACTSALVILFSQILRKNLWILRGTLKRWGLCCTIWWPSPNGGHLARQQWVRISKVDPLGVYMLTFHFIGFDARFQTRYTMSGKHTVIYYIWTLKRITA